VPRVPYHQIAVPTVGADGPGATSADATRPGTARPAGQAGAPGVETSAVVRARVLRARERQRGRLAGTGLACNAELGPAEVRRFCRTAPEAEGLLRAAMQRLHLSARAYHRVLKLARTIADLGSRPAPPACRHPSS
jgi:predicted ATPase with chaperone activity